MHVPTSRVATLIGFSASLAIAIPPDPSTLWQVQPDLDYSDTLYAGWDQIPVIKEVEIYNGVKEGRTYAHHPELFALDDNVYLIHSSAPIDEDSMGQDVWISTSKDGGMTWGPGSSLFPAALLPNQTDAHHNYTYYCNIKAAQRAWQALSFVHLPSPDGEGEGELYAIGQSGTRWCPGRFMTAGRIARRITFDGEPAGDPCWIEKNELTHSQLFNETVYGTKYGMKGCKRACEINEKLIKPDEAPAWSSWLYNNELFAADDSHSMQEQTHALWFNDSSSPIGGYWQRFWRDISGDSANTQKIWVEYNEEPEGRGWYPRRLAQYGNEIFQTNIPDARTKQYLGQVAESGDRYLVWNPRWNSEVRERQPLTLAMSRGEDQAYRSVGVLRTNASNVIAPDTRDGLKSRAHGFSYPTAIQVGDKLLVAYSENKENIWVSVVSLNDLPK
ncbi:hypothetical protein V2G26_018523 [Clonostachys chloroleuca]